MLLKYNADQKARDKNWQTPGHIAAAQNAVSCMDLMLNNIANVSSGDQGGRSGLHHAAHLGHYEMVELLLDKGHVPIGKIFFIAFCSFFPCSLTVVHWGRQRKSGGRQ